MTKTKLHLFEAFGIELEYMIVRADTLAVMPIADQLLMAEGGSYGDVERGPVAWSNELALHVIELKTNGPAAGLQPLPAAFQADVQHINAWLTQQGACLMPGGMHPFMDPSKETQLWPHEHSAVYEAFNRIFNCSGHGWSNLQSTHLNLPFAGDEEFARLHAALRLILPITPALAASSPIMDGRVQRFMDTRLHVYQDNTIRVPSVSGSIIPEPAFSRKDYEMSILARIYHDLHDEDPSGVLQHEWVNARGAIARFDRSTLELRLLDVQECPAADIAIAAAITAVLRAQVSETWVDLASQKAWGVKPLAKILRQVIVEGPAAVIDDAAYLRLFGYPGERASVGELWHHLVGQVWPQDLAEAKPYRPALDLILNKGPLAQRIVAALGRDTSKAHMRQVYTALCGCLARGQSFSGM